MRIVLFLGFTLACMLVASQTVQTIPDGTPSWLVPGPSVISNQNHIAPHERWCQMEHAEGLVIRESQMKGFACQFGLCWVMRCQ